MARWIGVFLLFLMATSGCSPEGPEQPRPEAADDTLRFLNVSGDVAYVGDAACVSCHEELYQRYQTHGMAQSFAPVTPDNVPGGFAEAERYHAETDFYYRLIEEEGRFYQEEYRLGPSGEKTHRLVRQMQYATGSGKAGYTYFTEQNGRYYQLPLSWYVHPSTWDFNPGYAENNQRFSRVLNNRCAFCHNSYPEPVAFSRRKYRSILRPIGCERCHGPGQRHVEERLADPEMAGTIDYSIVNPAHLPLDRQLDVCQQCHLNGTVALLREGRESFDFRPAEALASHVSLFNVVEPETGLIGVVSHADRMQQSACFRETRSQNRPLNCLTCHDPHEGFRDKGPAYFNATCQACHAPEALQARLAATAQASHTAGADCSSCHMPKVGADVDPHTSFTDHWIRVVVEKTPEVAIDPQEGPIELKPHFARDAEGREGTLYEALAYMSYRRSHGDLDAIERGARTAQKTLKSHPTFGEAHLLLGQSLLLLGQVEDALPPLQQAVRLDDGDPRQLHALAQALELAQGDPAEIDSLYRRALRIQPALAGVRVEYGDFLDLQGRAQEAFTAYTQAVEEEPWLAVAHHGVGFVLLRQGQYRQAEDAFRRTLALEPDHVDALVNLGIVLAATGRARQAQGRYERAVGLAPDHVSALYNLGTFYLQRNQLEESITLLRRAVEADPGYLNAHLNLALASLRARRYDEAREAAKAALRLAPDNVQASQILSALPR